jgi:phosphomannomutase
VSVSGIRGIVGRTFDKIIAGRFAQAFGTYTGGGIMVLSRDGRPSGVPLGEAVAHGLASAGCDVIDLGITPTPTCGFAIRHLTAAGGIQITASHNPAEWNGLKLFGPTGRVLSGSAGSEVKWLFEGISLHRHEGLSSAQPRHCTLANKWHCDHILQLVNVAAIGAKHFRVYLDANGGAGGPAARLLLDALGCTTIGQGCDADGVFLHEPEPIASNLTEVCPRTQEHDAAIGMVLDPDADRLALIDEGGRYIGEELTLALAIQFRLTQQRGPVVVNMSTSRVCEDIAKSADCSFYRSAVGEANVADMMQELGAVIGGEGNGGVIDPRVGYVRDPFIGIGLILSLMAQTGKKLSELVGELPNYHIVKEKYSINRSRLTELLDKIAVNWPDAVVNRLDGLRLDWPDRWVHVRPSNTEPIVRVIAEAGSEEQARSLCLEVGAILRE